MAIITCKNCQDRTESCHITCERYQMAKEKHEKIRTKKQLADEIYFYDNEYRIGIRNSQLRKYGKSNY